MKGDDTMFVTKRLISGLAALVMAVAGTLPTATAVVGRDESTTVADEDSRVLKHQSLELCPDESDSDKTVTLDGLMPKNATATAVDVTEMIADSDIVTSPLCDDSSVVVAYDITISDGEGEFQPDSSRPIYVGITDPSITESEFTELWHISDDGQREQISDFTVEDGKVSFYAEGFSVYAVVEAPEPTNAGDVKEQLTDFSEINQYASDGIYIYQNANGYYFTDEQDTRNNRTGIVATKELSNAKKYYFENTTGNYYKIYCIKDETKYYLKRNSSNLSLDTEENASEFTLNAPYYNKFIDKATNTKCLGYENGIITGANQNTFEFWYINSTPIPDDPYELDGKSYGFMNYESNSYAYAMQSNFKAKQMEAKVNPLSHEGINYIAKNSDITFWTFHKASEDNYYISTTDNDGNVKYIKVTGSGSSQVRELVDSVDDATPIKVIPQSGDNIGKIKLCADNKYLYLNGTSDFKFDTDKGSASLIKLVEKDEQITDDDFKVYSAEKIGISEAVNGEEYIVYTRVWDDTKKAYRFFAVDHDGTLVECYERGDDIMWIGSRINTLEWDFTEYYGLDGKPNYYYELCNTYSDMYLAPQIGGVALSDGTIGINLPGRQDGEYYSDILAWDEPHYAYAALVANSDNSKLTTTAKSKASTFYFAKVKEHSASELTEVETIDNDEYGITMKMVDWKGSTDNTGDVQNTFLNTDSKSHGLAAHSGLLSTDLEKDADGKYTYPTVLNGVNQSLGLLYNETAEDKIEDALREVNHLFIKSTYEATGYFEFDSCQNFATLKKQDRQFNTETVNVSEGVTKEVTNFTVYRQLGTNDSSAKTTLCHGQFLPYNTIKEGKYPSRNPYNLYSALANPDNKSIGLLDDSDPRKYERLHLVQESTDYFNGMELEASFVQTPNGKDNWNHDIIFEFTGDDDFWLYVDGELVIDLGGIHSALEGKVNFATGQVIVNGVEKTLRQVFKENYETRNPGASAADVNAYLAEYFDDGEVVFKDYSQHKMKIFYMERGAGASNLHMRFNLSYVTPGHVILKKEVEGAEDLDLSLVQYPFQIYYNDDSLHPDVFQPLGNDDANVSITYQNSTQKVEFKEHYTPPGCTDTFDNVFFLNPDQVAEIHFPSKTINYKVVECGLSSIYDSVRIKGEEDVLAAKPIAAAEGSYVERYYYETKPYEVEKKQSMVFVNKFKDGALRPLYFTKILKDENGHELTYDLEHPNEENVDNTTFQFRLYLTNGVDDELRLANMAKYRVLTPSVKIDEENSVRYYCSWDADAQRFVPTEYTSQSGMSTSLETKLKEIKEDTTLTAEEKQQKKEALLDLITFETSINGTISQIPAGYTVEVPNLTAGVRFKVVERPNETELGYGKVEYQVVNESYYYSSSGDKNDGTVNTEDPPEMNVINKRGYGLEVRKQWSDSDFTYNHNPIYVAVYKKNGNTETLLPGTVREISPKNSFVRYFFDGKEENDGVISEDDFNSYVVREVTLTRIDGVAYDPDPEPVEIDPESQQVKEKEPDPNRPIPDDDFKITNIADFKVAKVDNEGLLNKAYTMKEANKYVPVHNYKDEYTYFPTYNQGEPESVSEGSVGLKRKDSIRNDRGGGIIITLHDMDTKEPLRDGEFELREEDGNYVGKFTTDGDGQITILYKGENLKTNEQYTLSQTKAPAGYIGVPNTVKFKVEESGNVVTEIYVTGNDSKWANREILISNEESLIGHIRVYNKPFTLQVKKVDSSTGAPLKGAHFALYKCVNGVKDYTPMQNYTDIVSGENGVIAEISAALGHGTYCLEELSAPTGYEKLTADIRFTISSDGAVTATGSGSSLTVDDGESSCSYLIKISNSKKETSILLPTGIETHGAATASMLFLLVTFGAFLLIRTKMRKKE